MDEQILAVQRMQEYIDEHLGQSITLADLARTAMYSPWYSYRIFQRHTGLTVADYIRRLRLSRSALQLKAGGRRVIDVAFDMGFSSADGYTRAFRREFGCNPMDYARGPLPIPLFIPYGVKYRHIERKPIDMDNVQNIFIRQIRRPARKAIILRGAKAEDYWSYCQEVGCDVWGIVSSMDSLCGEPVCLWLPGQYRKPGTSLYVMGAEVPADYDGPVPEGFDVIDLPETEYLQFQGEPFAEEDFSEAIQRVWHAIERFDPATAGCIWDDEQPRIQLEPRGERGYIELKAVKPAK